MEGSFVFGLAWASIQGRMPLKPLWNTWPAADGCTAHSRAVLLSLGAPKTSEKPRLGRFREQGQWLPVCVTPFERLAQTLPLPSSQDFTGPSSPSVQDIQVIAPKRATQNGLELGVAHTCGN